MRIYGEFIAGLSCHAIAEKLTKMGIMALHLWVGRLFCCGFWGWSMVS